MNEIAMSKWRALKQNFSTAGRCMRRQRAEIMRNQDRANSSRRQSIKRSADRESEKKIGQPIRCKAVLAIRTRRGRPPRSRFQRSWARRRASASACRSGSRLDRREQGPGLEPAFHHARANAGRGDGARGRDCARANGHGSARRHADEPHNGAAGSRAGLPNRAGPAPNRTRRGTR